MSSFISKYICCCLNQDEPKIYPSVNQINITQANIPTAKDQFLDNDDPVGAILNSQQIQKVANATVNIFLPSKDQDFNPYVSGDKEDMIKYEKVVNDCRKQNPESVSNLLKDLISILPKKKQLNSHKRPQIQKNKQKKLISQIIRPQNSTTSKIRQKSQIQSKSAIKSTQRESKTQSAIKKRQKDNIQVAIKSRNTKSNLRYQKIQQKTSINSMSIIQENKLRQKIIVNQNTKIEQVQKKRPQNFIYQQDYQEVKQKIQQILGPSIEDQSNNQKLNKQSNQQKYLNIIKAFVFLYTSPYIYREMNQAFTQERYQNYAKIVSYVTDALQKLPKLYKEQISVKLSSGISLYRGIPQKNLRLPKSGYWKAFTSTSLDRRIASQFQNGKGYLIEIQLKSPMTHMHIKVPNNKDFSFFNQKQVILFPFFHFEIVSQKKNIIVIKEVKQFN